MACRLLLHHQLISVGSQGKIQNVITPNICNEFNLSISPGMRGRLLNARIVTATWDGYLRQTTVIYNQLVSGVCVDDP